MRRLINYIRSCFCKHDWELLTDTLIYEDESKNKPYKEVWIYRCKKCGCKNKITSD